ncbi:lysophospholipase [Ectobacillus antri]|uniref:Lysophospholipase n=1 Tax=Ectobacillus antri TaxID=2486280 RepID=A0ABT6H3F5_9BACI|nr:alpha/beta hydrolase [Ectobacillus antri]MDG4656452.1 lysophospholipase [Ectobacillus antri]MDG5753502.1 lysophospholipase [Ectobacillus antri]
MWKWRAEQPKAVVVIVHGAMEHHGRYAELGDKWTANGYHVVMGDLPGHGTSSRNRGHIDSFQEYIDEVLHWIEEAQRERLPVFLLGHSMGGLIVIRTLQETHIPVAGVILSSPCLGVVAQPPAYLRAASRILNRVMPRLRVASNLTVEMATRNKEIRDQMENDSLYLRKVSVRWYSELVKGIALAHTKQHRFPNVPLLLMQACEDKIVDKSTVRTWFDTLKINEKTYKEWDKCYHELFNEYERDEIFAMAYRFTEAHIKEK